MLAIAGGVVLGGMILYVLYECREEVARLLAWPFWAGVALLCATLLGAILLGGWRFASRLLGHSLGKFTVPEALFGWAVLIVVTTNDSLGIVTALASGARWCGRRLAYLMGFTVDTPK
jgi:hypothetical protein